MEEVIQIDIKNLTYYFCNDIIDIKDFQSKLLKTDKKRTNTLTFTTLNTSKRKNLMIVKKSAV